MTVKILGNRRQFNKAVAENNASLLTVGRWYYVDWGAFTTEDVLANLHNTKTGDLVRVVGFTTGDDALIHVRTEKELSDWLLLKRLTLDDPLEAS